MPALVEKHLLIGCIHPHSTLEASVSPQNGKLIGYIARNAHDALDYTGEYEAVSKIDEDQVLETAKRYLSKNIVVKAIPYAEVSNLFGGKTVTIGG